MGCADCVNVLDGWDGLGGLIGWMDCACEFECMGWMDGYVGLGGYECRLCVHRVLFG